jgi:hypothetical protein
MASANAHLMRWMYRGKRPNGIARTLNRIWAAIGATGVAPNYFVTLEVTGRQSGRTVAFPMVIVVLAGQRLLGPM